VAETALYDETELPLPFRWQALDFMRMEWPEIFSGADRLHLGIYPEAAHPVHVVVSEEDLLISYATVIWIW
jgi:hypothetical protein